MKRLRAFLAALLLSVSGVLGLNMGQALAATCTWTGATNDNFNTAANWSGCGSGVPQTGDNITFNSASLTSTKTLNNDISGLSVATITFTGTNSSGYTYELTGNGLTTTAGIVANAGAVLDLNVTVSGNQTWSGTSYLNVGKFGGTARTLAVGSNTLTLTANSIFLYGSLTGSGAVTNSGSLYLQSASSSWSGTINTTGTGVTDVFAANGLGSGAVTVASGGALNFCGPDGASFSNAITLGGSSAISTFVACGQGGGSSDSSDADVNLTGPVTLTANTTVHSFGVTKITGALSGNYTIGLASGSTGSLVIDSSNNTSKTPNGTITAGAKTVTIEKGDDQPNVSVSVENNQTYIINGTRGATIVNEGGTLKGSGTVGDLLIAGHVAPGQSPGCLTAGSLQFEEGAVYEFEAAGTTACTEYDQLKTAGTVLISGGTVELTLLDGFKPKQGQTFTIIDNTGSDAIDGTFTNMPEGATFALNGYVYKISYVGGTGNDVTLTVLNVPTSPDTGFAVIQNNPLVSMVAMVAAGGALLFLARRFKLAHAPARTRRR